MQWEIIALAVSNINLTGQKYVIACKKIFNIFLLKQYKIGEFTALAATLTPLSVTRLKLIVTNNYYA